MSERGWTSKSFLTAHQKGTEPRLIGPRTRRKKIRNWVPEHAKIDGDVKYQKLPTITSFTWSECLSGLGISLASTIKRWRMKEPRFVLFSALIRNFLQVKDFECRKRKLLKTCLCEWPSVLNINITQFYSSNIICDKDNKCNLIVTF